MDDKPHNVRGGDCVPVTPYRRYGFVLPMLRDMPRWDALTETLVDRMFCGGRGVTPDWNGQSAEVSRFCVYLGEGTVSESHLPLLKQHYPAEHQADETSIVRVDDSRQFAVGECAKVTAMALSAVVYDTEQYPPEDFHDQDDELLTHVIPALRRRFAA